MHNHCIRKIKMYPPEWEHLEQLARETGSYIRDGSHVGQTSWTALVRRIARGEVKVVEVGPHLEHIRRVEAAIARSASSGAPSPVRPGADAAKMQPEEERQAVEVQKEYKQLALVEST